MHQPLPTFASQAITFDRAETESLRQLVLSKDILIKQIKDNMSTTEQSFLEQTKLKDS